MCGKITQMTGWSADLADLAGLQGCEGPSETVTPMRFATVIACGEAGLRKPVRMRWGFLPPGTREVLGTKPHIHARAETIDTKPAFRQAFAARRGILAVSSFNEAREAGPRKTEQHVLTPDDGAPIGIAVIYEAFREKAGIPLLTFAMVTVAANPLIGTITDRMPALLDPADWPLWLGETGASLAAIKALLRPSARALTMKREVKQPRPQPGQADLF